MISTLSTRKSLGTPRRNDGAGGSGLTPFLTRESTGQTHVAPYCAGAWGTGRLDRSSFSGHPNSAMSSPWAQQHQQQQQQQQQQLQQHQSSNARSSKDEYKTACRDRWINVSKTMMGERAEIAMSCGSIYEGVIHAVAPKGPMPGGTRGVYQVVMRSARAKRGVNGANSSTKIGRQGGTLVLAGEDIVSITVKRFPLQQNSGRPPTGLGTDAAIGSRTVGGTGIRSLKKVERSWVSGGENLSLKGGVGKWDQFEANQRLFNVTSSFDENLYTTRLDKSSLTKQQVADAERLAAEISSKSSSNIHMREERNMMTKMDDRMGEEERFGGVLGTGGLAQTTLDNGSGGSGPRHSSPRDHGVTSSVAPSSGKTSAAGSSTGLYVPPSLRSPSSPVQAGGVGPMAANNLGALNGRQMQSTAADTKLADAKAVLLDVLDGKHRSTPPPENNNGPKPGEAVASSSDTTLPEKTAAPSPSTPGDKKALAAAEAGSEKSPSDTPNPKKTPAPSLTTPGDKKALPVAEAAGVSTPLLGGGDVRASSVARSTNTTVASSVLPSVPATASTKAPSVTSHPPLAASRVTKTGGGAAKKKSSLRASAKEWKPPTVAGTRTSIGSAAAAPVAIPSHTPAPIQAQIRQQVPPQTPVQAQAPTQAPATSMMAPSPRSGGNSGFGTGKRGVISGVSMHQHLNHHSHHAAGVRHEQQQQKQQTSPHRSRQSSPRPSPHSSRDRQGYFFPQHGSPRQASTQQYPVQQQQQQPPPQQPPAMVNPPYLPGSMPAAGPMGPGGSARPHHMAGIPPHPMMGLHPGQVHPQHYLQLLYRTPMGHHPQQVFIQPPPAGMRIPMAPGQLQVHPQQSMPMMMQQGAPVAPPGSPFCHANMQQQQQQQSQMQLPPQIPVQQGQQQPRSFIMQGHPVAGPAPGPHYAPPESQQPVGVTGVMGTGGGMKGAGGSSPHGNGGETTQGNNVFGGHSRKGRGGGRGVRGSGLSRQNSASRKHRGGSTS